MSTIGLSDQSFLQLCFQKTNGIFKFWHATSETFSTLHEQCFKQKKPLMSTILNAFSFGFRMFQFLPIHLEE